MSFRSLLFVYVFGACVSTLASAQGILDQNFEDRLGMFTNWASQEQTHTRSLSAAQAPSPPPSPTSGNGTCKVLRYYTGYANLTVYWNKTILDSPNFGECCKACNRDPLCKGWTRVAGGEPANFRKCYLKYSLKALPVGTDLAVTNSRTHVGPPPAHPNDATLFPELRYVNPSYTVQAGWPVILESGTKDDVYPAEYYGCPYTPSAVTPCIIPKGCNYNGNHVFVAPPCLE